MMAWWPYAWWLRIHEFFFVAVELFLLNFWAFYFRKIFFRRVAWRVRGTYFPFRACYEYIIIYWTIFNQFLTVYLEEVLPSSQQWSDEISNSDHPKPNPKDLINSLFFPYIMQLSQLRPSPRLHVIWLFSWIVSSRCRRAVVFYFWKPIRFILRKTCSWGLRSSYSWLAQLWWVKPEW